MNKEKQRVIWGWISAQKLRTCFSFSSHLLLIFFSLASHLLLIFFPPTSSRMLSGQAKTATDSS